ncbi:hypothetical protein BO94DRAFT_35338 [Aspergillus sclerotioniger CBS 115572]|uniref:Uncharacterized protein n=1 Tax=Aspergillus sclerotioniger CBS 115572 TaxID=1450535 RepID=A0A317WSU9_9EURO|nr:hypothetical protein BO94DRAFT_35338 [Aspergillus sclerotioniger CBS 115572]PWY89436.1 hypothetical protein BO94DRAFT_35338 [Aspergillus sclerotioniger CBS 115572]
MSRKVPHAAFCEEYDEDAHVILPETRQVANLTSKRSKPALRSPASPLVDVASDSGYSSRTAATVNSTQSGPSGRKSPVPLKLDTSLVKRADLDRVVRSKVRERPKDRIARPPREDKMQVGPYPNGVGHAPAHAQRSPSRSRGRESSQVRHFPGACWECDNGLYHASTPVESRPMDYPYYMSQPPSSGQDYPPPSPRDPRYNPNPVQDIQVSRSTRPPARGSASMYHPNNRPVSFHGMIPGMGQMMYPPSNMGRYEHGPPLSSSAYANSPSYAPSHYGQQSYYGMPDFVPPAEHRQGRSVSSTRDQPRGRRQSLYGSPVVDYDSASAAFDDEEALDPSPPPPREPRPRIPSHSSHERDEDYYRMPPPPIKHKPTPHIIQKRPEPRKMATAPSITSDRHSTRSFEMNDLKDALPDGYGYRRTPRETVVPERSRSFRRPPTAYHGSARPSRIAVENSRRRRSTVYDFPDDDEEDDDEEEEDDEMDEKHREAEEYQATRTAKAVPPAPPVPLTADALYKAKGTHRAESDSGSQKSRSNSSRGSDARTQTGSNAGSKPEEDNNIVMTLNGVTMSFPQDSVGGKRISVRTGETGAVELNIEGKQRPKKYLTNGSEYTGSVAPSRREIEDSRRARSDRKSDRASHRSSRSSYGRY